MALAPSSLPCLGKGWSGSESVVFVKASLPLGLAPPASPPAPISALVSSPRASSALDVPYVLHYHFFFGLTNHSLVTCLTPPVSPPASSRSFVTSFTVSLEPDVVLAPTHRSLHGPLVASTASFPVSAHVSSHTLSLSFNGRQFYSLSDVLAHISDYPEGEDRVAVYIDVVRQASNIFDLGASFALGLMNAIKKDKSFAMALWTKKHVKQLLVPLNRNVKAARIGKT